MLLQIRRLFLSSAVSLFLCARMVLFFCVACIYAKLELLYLGLRDILRVAREKRFQAVIFTKFDAGRATVQSDDERNSGYEKKSF